MKKDIFKEVGEEWGDYLKTDENIDETKFYTEKYNFDNLLECYDKWREKANEAVFDSYQLAKKLLKEYRIPVLSEEYINEFAENIASDRYYCGLFFSAIIDELYENEEIHLYFNNSNYLANYLGSYNEDKKIIVEGDCNRNTGLGMEGGKIIVEGDCGYGIGNSMLGGEIRIYGDDFKPNEHIFKWARKGKIYHKDKLVWEDGKFIGDSI